MGPSRNTDNCSSLIMNRPHVCSGNCRLASLVESKYRSLSHTYIPVALNHYMVWCTETGCGGGLMGWGRRQHFHAIITPASRRSWTLPRVESVLPQRTHIHTHSLIISVFNYHKPISSITHIHANIHKHWHYGGRCARETCCWSRGQTEK